MTLIKLIDLPLITDTRGSLVAIESLSTIPFQIKRVYYLFATKENEPRGFHAHKNLQQLAICVAGACTFVLDDGKNRERVVLNSASKGLLVEKMVWREMHDFSADCVLLVLASEPYSEEDYIRSYDKFLESVKV